MASAGTSGTKPAPDGRVCALFCVHARSIPCPRPVSRNHWGMVTIADAITPLGTGPLTDEGVARHIRPLFSRVLNRPEIYLANHALGRPLDQTADDIREALDLWYEKMDDAWKPWLAEMDAFRARIARLIGCPRPDAVVPKTAAGQGLRAVLNAHGTPGTPAAAKPIHVVATRGEFDSIDFILRTYAARGRARITWIDPDENGLFNPEQVIQAISMTVDLVVVSQVVFSTGQVLGGLRKIAAAIHAVGGHLLIDCYHSAGAIPVNFADTDADFAIGGSYKYVRGGTGACWLAINPKHLIDQPRPATRRHALATLDTGWFAKHERWSWDRGDEATLAAGGDAWLESTPAILPFYQARAGLEFTLAIGIERLRRHNLEQQAYLRDRLTAAGVPVVDLDAKNEPGHGAFLLVPAADWRAAAAALKAKGLNVDARPAPRPHTVSGSPAGNIRFCPDILTTREEMDRAAKIVAETLR